MKKKWFYKHLLTLGESLIRDIKNRSKIKMEGDRTSPEIFKWILMFLIYFFHYYNIHLEKTEV